MMLAAREILEGESHRPLLIGVTVLTSMSQTGHQELGSIRELGSQVDYLAGLARDSGLDGVVCSAQEVRRLRQSLGSNFYLVPPGIRPSWAATDDQTRIVTPSEAIAHGSDYLVIGLPITASDHPGNSVIRIIKEL